jgi:hypothetical protein
MNGDRDLLNEQDSVGRKLAIQRLRTNVALQVSPYLWDNLGDDGLIAPVVDDIVDRWISLPAGPGRLPLIGPGGFAAAYLAAVEHNADGGPWWQFCQRDADGRPVADDTYPRRVWTHHAQRLELIHPTTKTDMPDPLPSGPAGKLVVERLRTQAAIEVTAAVSDWLGRDVEKLAAVVGDVVAGWLALPAAQRLGMALTGRGQFVEQYVARVLYADPADDEYRTEFCPPDGQPLDWDTYTLAVWTHHSAQLVGPR